MSSPPVIPSAAIAPFRFDVTPPLGHPLLAGLVPPAAAHDDPLEAIGYALLGAGAPIVVCVLDWAGLMNEAHLAWRRALAEAAGTTPERVAVHCVHQHNAPFVCPEANRLATEAGLPPLHDPAFFAACLDRARAAVRAALRAPRRIASVATGSAAVREVASNRRVHRDEQSRVISMRLSACTDPALVALPEGSIDPDLQTVAFYDETGQRIVACHYYATHPMSYYRDGRVSSDFCGLARKRRQAEDPGCTHLYFTGCAGNVAAGKYNDGSPASRRVLTDRMHAAIAASERALVPAPIRTIAWRTQEILPTPRPTPSSAEIASFIGDAGRSTVDRTVDAFRLAWRRRVARGVPLVLSCLRINDLSVVHLPGEMFVDYQLRARALRGRHPVAVAAYGDDGLWYVPTREEFRAGGYEVGVTFCDENVDDTMTAALERLLR